MPGLARQGDAGITHCTPYTIAQGSPDVYTNSCPTARVGDPSTLHKRPGGKSCVPHVSTIATGSSTVFINNKPAARLGDPLTQCTRIAQASVDVFVGG